MKFTPEGRVIQIQVRRQDDLAVVTVRDPGLGVREDEHDRILLPFVRGTAAQGTIPGWGLGLYIADQAVKAHGGALALRGAPRAGTTATIRLPL
jgi:signal transduction histidine kinase